LASLRKKTEYIVIHCSAKKRNQNIGAEEIRQWHVVDNGWKDIGYHYVIRRSGVIEDGRPEDEIGAHVAGYNSISVGICMVGGLADNGKAENNFTNEQWKSLARLVRMLRAKYKKTVVCGHRDLSPDLNKDGAVTPNEWIKECPSFSVANWLKKENIL